MYIVKLNCKTHCNSFLCDNVLLNCQIKSNKYPAEFTNMVVINITRYVYLYAFASFSQKPLSNYIRKKSYC